MSWSPNNRQIAFMQDPPDGGADIWIMNRDGSDARCVTSKAQFQEPGLSSSVGPLHPRSMHDRVPDQAQRIGARAQDALERLAFQRVQLDGPHDLTHNGDLSRAAGRCDRLAQLGVHAGVHEYRRSIVVLWLGTQVACREHAALAEGRGSKSKPGLGEQIVLIREVGQIVHSFV